jgi:hypothetical protein
LANGKKQGSVLSSTVIPLIRPGSVAVSIPLLLGKVTVAVRGNWPEELGVADWVNVTLAVPEMGVELAGEMVVRVPLRVPM